MKVLIVSYGGGHAQISTLVYKALQQRGNVELNVLALTVAGSVFAKHHISYTTLHQCMGFFEDKEDIIRYGREWAESFFNPASDMIYEECVAYLGLGFRDLKNREGFSEAREAFRKFGRKAVCAVESMEIILRHLQPDVLVVTCGVRMEKAAGLAANRLGIPVVRIGDLLAFEPSGYDCLMCVMNEYAKEYAIHELGIPPSRVFLTGQPVFEENLRISPMDLDSTVDQWGMANFKQIVLYLEQPGMDFEIKSIEACFLKIANRYADILFIFKLHPNQDKKENQWVSENVLLLQDYPLKPLLHLCDVAVTKDSTAGLEAVLCGKPLVSILLSPPDVDYTQYGIAERVTNLHNLEKALFQCVDTSSTTYIRQCHAREKCGNRPNAAVNIANLIFCVAYGHYCRQLRLRSL